MSTLDKLVRMANQIASNFEIHGEEEAVLRTSEHIAKYWEPRMKIQLRDYLIADGKKLEPIAKAAASRALEEAQ